MARVPFDRRQQGFTIIELLIAVAIVGALAGLAIPNYLGFLDKARVARAIAEIRYIERVIDSYEAAYDALPNSLAQAGAGEMVDPWGNPYEYLNIAALTLPGNGGGGGGGGGGNGGGSKKTPGCGCCPMRHTQDRVAETAAKENRAKTVSYTRSTPTMTCTAWAKTVRVWSR